MMTAAVGLLTDPVYVEEILQSGQADLVVLGRMMLWDPYWPHHAAAAMGIPLSLPVQYERSGIHSRGCIETLRPRPNTTVLPRALDGESLPEERFDRGAGFQNDVVADAHELHSDGAAPHRDRNAQRRRTPATLAMRVNDTRAADTDGSCAWVNDGAAAGTVGPMTHSTSAMRSWTCSRSSA